MVEHYINFINNSKLFAGCIMLLMNLGGKYIVKELPEGIDQIFDNPWIRRFIIFSIIFIATRDILSSLLITLFFILMTQFILNRQSKFCMLNKKLEPPVTKLEAAQAVATIKKYKKQQGFSKSLAK